MGFILLGAKHTGDGVLLFEECVVVKSGFPHDQLLVFLFPACLLRRWQSERRLLLALAGLGLAEDSVFLFLFLEQSAVAVAVAIAETVGSQVHDVLVVD